MTTRKTSGLRDASKPSPPDGLKPGGRMLWRRVTDSYHLRPDELLTLEYACRSRDRITEMRSSLAGMDVMVLGSTGQLVVNPLIAELRQHESHQASLLAKLKLPDLDGGGTIKGNTQRENGSKRWEVPAEADGPAA